MPLWLKSKVYKTVIRPVLLYGSECWTLKMKEERKLFVTEMRMLIWMSCISLKDHIKNEEIRSRVKITSIVDKMMGSRLRWFGHVERRDENYVGRKVLRLVIQGGRPRGRPKKRWFEVIREDMPTCGLERDMAVNRALRRQKSWKGDPV
jgi:hypothetical protein